MLKILHDIPEMQSCCVALGYFDGIHLGHEAVIDAAFSGSGTKTVLCVGTRADKPLFDMSEIGCQLEKLGAEVYLKPDFAQMKDMSGESFVRDVLIGSLHASRVACGENYRFGAGAACDAADLQRMCSEFGVECETVPMVRIGGEVVSATAIRGALSQGDVQRVNEYLGRRYAYSLPVVDGQRLGRRLGTPTINQNMMDVHLPRFGVYASVVYADGRWFDAVTNIGVKPTVGSDVPVSETWLRGYEGDLYGKTVRVELVEFIRPERKFDSIDELRAQIMLDGERALAVTGEISQKLNLD